MTDQKVLNEMVSEIKWRVKKGNGARPIHVYISNVIRDFQRVRGSITVSDLKKAYYSARRA